MAKEERITSWLDHVHEDISSAECLFMGGHWLYVGFLCHQALEKALKAYYTANNDDDPPYTHSHTRLLNVCGLTDELTDAQLRFIALMEPMYIEARYPEQKAETAKMLNKEACQHIISNTKELTQWIEEKLLAAKKPSE
ncbi:MAG: HEPN domain-containing protein [Bacteroidaceae bacterium]|nr:HEPN domain-containing protein [Bacteroidaceae bacterium]